jgi:hypothetical protein
MNTRGRGRYDEGRWTGKKIDPLFFRFGSSASSVFMSEARCRIRISVVAFYPHILV